MITSPMITSPKISSPMITWQRRRFSDLTGLELHQVLALRQQVFILEQQCIYPDIDGRDPIALHLLGVGGEKGLLAYARVLAPGEVYSEPTVGRVAVMQDARGSGVAKALMTEAHNLISDEFSSTTIRLNAQTYLKGFYEALGYEVVSSPYDEDGIEHIEMLRKSQC